MEQSWPFDQPPNCAVISLRQIVNEGVPILRVSHDADDHGWQFLGGEQLTPADAMIVSLAEIVKIEPGLFALADLPPGWIASRQNANSKWVRENVA